MARDNAVSITPVTRNFPLGGGGNAILTSGSGTWTAAVSEPWLTLSSTSGSVGVPVAYTVTATTNIGQRVGYVYVSGHVHTVTQDGYEAAVSPTEIVLESDGGTGSIALDSPGRYSWDARPNNDWLSISPTHGVASGVLTYQVAPYNEVATRSGSFTVGDKTVTVFQYGRRMKLSTYRESRDYLTHVIPITVNALAITTWSVTPNVSWISVVDGGNGQGGDLVSIAIAENPSWKSRTGTVTIGTETFTVTQEGRTVLEFAISPSTATAAVSGGNGLLAVTATPDLPWTAASSANWLTIVSGFTSGAGNGNVVYNASPNPTLSQRTGKITVAPVGGSGLNAKTLTVTQPAAEASVSPMGYEFGAPGGSVDVEVTVNSIVEWSVDEALDWISISGSASRQGPGTVRILASANNTVYPRSGTVRIAGKTFSVSQKARGVEVEYESIVFGVDGGMSSVSIHPDGNMAWTAVASDVWIIIFQNASGTGDAEIEYILAPYEGDGSPRTGWIQIGDKKVYITQRAYDLDITPRAGWVTGNAGEGEIGVAAGLNDIWHAIVTEGSWITIVSGYDAKTGSGTVRFTYTENNTGMTRTGKIMIAGEVYTLTQAARILVNINADVVGGGTVSGAGTHTMGEIATLTAIPKDGYEFLYWTGDAGETMQNPIRVTADVAKNVTAHFGPLTPEFTNVESSTEGVRLTWQNLAWATQYKIYRAPTSEFPTKEIVTLAADGSCSYFDTTGTVGTPYFYWVEAIGASDTTESKDAASGTKQRPIVYSSITYTNLKGATHSNPSTYQEGVELAFSAPGAVTGYTFTGWDPAMITVDMTGAMVVRATWKANTYQIAYYANGGSGTMAATDCEYDKEGEIAANGFTRSGYVFKGWAMEENGEVVYQPGAKVTNLTSNDSGVIKLYAVWELDVVETPVIVPGDGSVFRTTSCKVSISCATEGAQIYYTTNGRTPREDERCLYTGEFEIEDTTTVIAFAVLDGKSSEFAEALIAKGSSESLTLENVLDAGNLTAVSAGGDADWCPIEDVTSKVGGSCAVSGILDESDGELRESWLEVKVSGKGTLAFWWRVSCEPDIRGKYTYDYASCEVDGELVARTDGEKDWVQISKTFDVAGDHVVRWTYLTDGWESEGYDGCVWVDGVSWMPADEPHVTPTYAITYGNLNGATHSNPASYSEGSEVTFTAPSSRTGYAFTGWTPSAITAEMTGPQMVSAGWAAIVYQIKYELDGGTNAASNPATYTIEDEVTLAAPTRSGYTFSGWTPNGGKIAKGSTGAKTFTATWTKNVVKYTISFNANGGGSTPSAITCDEGAEYGELPAVTRTGYTFDGWYTAATGGAKVTSTTKATGSVALYAHWTAVEYAIAYNLDGGTNAASNPATYTIEDEVTLAAPTRSGYTFSGWTPKGGKIAKGSTGAKTFTANWTKNVVKYTISFNANGGDSTPSAITCDEGAEYGELPAVTRTGYTFDGWYTAATGGAKVTSMTKSTGSVTLYAHWTAVKYAITYNLDGGTNASSNPATYTIEDAVTLAAPTRSGYTFSGWTPNDGKIAKESTGAKTFTAIWTKNVVAKYTISFNVNGGSSTPSAITCDEGAEYGELPAVTRTGYTFDGWYTAATGGTKVTSTTKATGSVTLYAHWTAIPSGGGLYMVVDMSNSKSYKVSYLDAVPSGGWTDEFKTTKLVLRRIEAGTFTLGASNRLDNKPHSVTFSSSYYIGVFEVTQRQWELVMGDRPSFYSNGYYKTRPVEQVSYNRIRGSAEGAKWPQEKNVDEDSFVGRFRILTGMDFDLPTEAQWEHACSDETTDLGAVCRYLYNGGDSESVSSGPDRGSAFVGSYRANSNGLYDMLGNMWEWCLDWYGDVGTGVDPAGPDTGTKRILRGGCRNSTSDCSPTCRGTATPDLGGNIRGFRLAVVLRKNNDPIPELPSSASADEVRVALEGSADAKLQENITDAMVYGQYREWAMKIGAESVKGAANSWISFAVDSAALLEKVPVDGDLKIEEFKPAAAEGVFDFTVSVKDVTVGSGATDANLKKVFGLGGTTQLGTEEFDSAKVALEFGTPVNGKLKFTASPKDKTAKSFFMKMKVK